MPSASALQPRYLRELARARRCGVRGVAKCFSIDNVGPMRSVQRSFRILTWCSVILLAVLSLLPAQNMVRTGIRGELEHFAAYAGATTIAMVGYGQRRGMLRVIGSFWLYAGVLEYLQHFSPGRHPSIADFAASALGALFGGLTAALLAHFLWRGIFERRLI